MNSHPVQSVENNHMKLQATFQANGVPFLQVLDGSRYSSRRLVSIRNERRGPEKYTSSTIQVCLSLLSTRFSGRMAVASLAGCCLFTVGGAGVSVRGNST